MSENTVGMKLVRGSTDRLKLDWSQRDFAVGPDGYEYPIQSEHVRGEGRSYWAMLPSGAIRDCPYGYIATLAEARRVCEWHAWKRATERGDA